MVSPPNSTPDSTLAALTCSSTTDRQQRVRFFMMLLGRPRVTRELQSWLLFLPSVERERGKVQQPLKFPRTSSEDLSQHAVTFLDGLANRRWIDWACGHGGVRSRIWKLMSGVELLLASPVLTGLGDGHHWRCCLTGLHMDQEVGEAAHT